MFCIPETEAPEVSTSRARRFRPPRFRRRSRLLTKQGRAIHGGGATLVDGAHGLSSVPRKAGDAYGGHGAGARPTIPACSQSSAWSAWAPTWRQAAGSWYQKAESLGSPEATQRLSVLANR